MRYQINNELLNYVFTDNQQTFKYDDVVDNLLKYKWLQEKFIEDDANCMWNDLSINIYQFIHLCKIWALSHGYTLYSGMHKNESYCYINLNAISTSKCYHLYDTFGETEEQAVINACEWIIDEIRNKG